MDLMELLRRMQAPAVDTETGYYDTYQPPKVKKVIKETEGQPTTVTTTVEDSGRKFFQLPPASSVRAFPDRFIPELPSMSMERNPSLEEAWRSRGRPPIMAGNPTNRLLPRLVKTDGEWSIDSQYKGPGSFGITNILRREATPVAIDGETFIGKSFPSVSMPRILPAGRGVSALEGPESGSIPPYGPSGPSPAEEAGVDLSYLNPQRAVSPEQKLERIAGLLPDINIETPDMPVASIDAISDAVSGFLGGQQVDEGPTLIGPQDQGAGVAVTTQGMPTREELDKMYPSNVSVMEDAVPVETKSFAETETTAETTTPTSATGVATTGVQTNSGIGKPRPDYNAEVRSDRELVNKYQILESMYGKYARDPKARKQQYLDEISKIYRNAMILNAIAQFTGGQSQAGMYVKMATEKLDVIEKFDQEERMQGLWKDVFFDQNGEFRSPGTWEETYNAVIKLGGTPEEAKELADTTFGKDGGKDRTPAAVKTYKYWAGMPEDTEKEKAAKLAFGLANRFVDRPPTASEDRQLLSELIKLKSEDVGINSAELDQMIIDITNRIRARINLPPLTQQERAEEKTQGWLSKFISNFADSATGQAKEASVTQQNEGTVRQAPQGAIDMLKANKDNEEYRKEFLRKYGYLPDLN